ncbi:hypothetical protein MPTK2_4g21680 [Marchantia polymorpha subsp. ruderalis]
MKQPWSIRLGLKLLWVSAVLVIQSAVAISEGGFSSDLYGLVLEGCRDKLQAWSSQQQQQQQLESSSMFSPYSSSGVFMRGRWWRQEETRRKASSSASEFFQASDGKFDFLSSRINASRGGIHNVTASIFILDSKQTPIGPIIEASGLLNVGTWEACLVGCAAKPFTSPTFTSPDDDDDSKGTAMITADSSTAGEIPDDLWQGEQRDCSLRGSMEFVANQGPNDLTVTGTMESARNSSDPQWFAPISLSGKVFNNVDHMALYRHEVFIGAGLYAIEAAILVWQIIYSVRSPSGYFVSVLAILVQIVVMSFSAAGMLYIPIRLLNYRHLKHLFTNLFLIPSFLILLLIVLNFLFLSLILRKRRMAKRSNIPDRPHEIRLASVCIVLYAAIGAVLWSLQNFRTYLQVVRCWFLLPQVVANVFWDLRTKPLHPVYTVGVSLLRIASIGYDSLRPTIYGYDEFSDFPWGWFLGITATVLFFLVYCLVQQSYGGRCFLPQRWFGYQQLPKSNSQASQQESSSKPEDRILDL